jgi:hypothetical protein
MMKKRLTPPHYLGIFLVLLFCSCTNDDSKEIELTERQQLQNKFSLANFDDDFI